MYKPYRFEVKLEYLDHAFVTIKLEVAVEEVGGLDLPELVRSDDGAAVFAAVGLPEPGPVLALPLHHQIAQKLHACTAPDEDGWINDRAHDLVDLQLAERAYDGPLSDIRTACERLFVSRRRHEWPPRVYARDGWRQRHAEEAEGLDVLQNLGDAVDWTNEFIARIVRS